MVNKLLNLLDGKQFQRWIAPNASNNFMAPNKVKDH